MNVTAARNRLAGVVRTLAAEYRDDLEVRKACYVELAKPDFIWHFLLQSFSTMGSAAGSNGLIRNKENYKKVKYEILKKMSRSARVRQVKQTLLAASVRWPERKTDFIMKCFDCVKKQGGPVKAKSKLLALPGRQAKIDFLDDYPGIGQKYARNIMMDVYHEDFRDSIAIDIRINAISKALGLSFSSQQYTEHEKFYLEVAHAAGLNGWELDRLMFNYRKEVESRLGIPVKAIPSRTQSCG
jgi:hypothetical protein